ncbi:hypothetical protein QM012_002138 [Aureobasidium pullulans]|uniref:Peptidase S8/S53 domain-containing protein n=1 Tax=Aureobasidium pullulans TaxID=5580 RepID=A0ABR0TB29_AURPU
MSIAQRSDDNLAPLFKARSNDTRADTYIVTLCENVDYHDHFRTIGRDLEADNSTSFKWFKYADSYYATDITSDWISKIRKDPAVEAIDEWEPWEQIKQLDAPEGPEPVILERDSLEWDPAIWSGAPWHLQALSAGAKLDNIPDQGTATQIKYNNIIGGGQGVNIYIVDSGVDVDHKLFGGRARNFHKSYINNDGDFFQDKTGHGTAVAGCAAGRFFGTAQGVNIINVKTFFKVNNKRPAQTIPQDFLDALKDILEEHLANVENPPPGFKGSVVNLSLGGDTRGANSARKVISRMHAVGIAVVAAAGNGREAGVSADDVWPCKWNTICVGGMSRQYQQDWYSNTGTNVTVFAPGTDIKTLINGGGAGYSTGTSFAAPLVAGVLATFMGWENLGYAGLNNPDLIRSRLNANSSKGILSDKINGNDLGGSANNVATTGINYPGKPAKDPYNGVGDGITNNYLAEFISFDIATSSDGFPLHLPPLEPPQPSPVEGPTVTETPTDVPAAATTEAEVDDNDVDLIGDGRDDDASEPTATATPTVDRPKIITPTGDGNGCISVGCPDGYICNTVGNCVLE